MKVTESTVSELTFLFKLLPLFHEVDSVDRLYRLLLAIVTSGRAVGHPMAVLLVPDECDGVVRGRYGVERSGEAGVKSGRGAGRAESGGFDEMARRVFEAYERVDATDLTVKARSYSVPSSWHRSAIVKAARTRYPVLAERGASEFATDTFFDYFGVKSYIALPIEMGGRTSAVLAVERPADEDRSSTDEISVLYSLVQQTVGAAERLIGDSNHRRRARILSKLHGALYAAAAQSEFEESLKALLAMVCRAVGASVCLLKNGDSQKTIRVDAESSRGGQVHEAASAAALDAILELSAGALEPVGGDGSHPMLKGDAERKLSFFFACPLLVGRDCFGALAVARENDGECAKPDDFTAADKSFIELSAAVVASAVESRRSGERIGRLEDLIQELGSNLVRERERSRIGDRSIEYHMRVGEEIRRLRGALAGGEPAVRLREIAGIVGAIEDHAAAYWEEVTVPEGDCAMADLFGLVRRALERWSPAAAARGVQVSARIPEDGPSLLLDRDRILSAIEKILTATLSCLAKDDKVLVECSLAEGRALVCVADTGKGLPGDAMSRLMMPFADVVDRNKGTRALSLAGEILQKHCAEIMIKSSPSWRTILVLSFPMSAGRDRRKRPADRRNRRERRTTSRASRS